MIQNRKFVVYTTATNASSLGYLSTLPASINSSTKHDFVDEFYVLDGHSTDDTGNFLQKLASENPKLKILTSPRWEKDNWTWKTLLEQYNFFYDIVMQEVSETNNEMIVLYQCSDQIWIDDYAHELYENLNKMIVNNCDVLISPFRKTINASHITEIYNYSPDFSVYSSLRFRPQHSYRISGNENELISSYSVKKMKASFKNAPISYDMTFFTRRNLQDKITHHQCGINHRKIDEYVVNGFLRKCLTLNPTRILNDQHPIEIRDQIKNINPNLFGYDCFGHFRGL